MDKNKQKHIKAPGWSRARAHGKNYRLGLSVMMALLMAFGLMFPVLGGYKKAYAETGTTSSDGIYHQVYDDNGDIIQISHLQVDGRSAFCVQRNKHFQPGMQVEGQDAISIFGQEIVTQIALYEDYVYSLSELNSEQKYFITQMLVWETIENGVFPGGLRIEIGLDESVQTAIKAAAREYYETNKNSYIGSGTFWNAGENQSLAEFRAVRLPSVNILKLDAETEAPLGGVTFAIAAEEGGSVVSATTDANGVIAYPNLLPGTYTVYETETLPGYILSDEVLAITVDENGLINGSDSVELVFHNDFTKLSILKSDITTGDPLAGAVLQILATDEAGEPIGDPLLEWTTETQPLLLERFPQGNYILREISAPSGYVKALDIPFVVEDTGEIQPVEMKNDYTKEKIIKVDADTGELLAGAHFKVMDSEGSVVLDWVSSEEPYIFDRLAQGEYTLREVSAPEGYELAEDIKFTVQDTEELQVVTMADKKTPDPEKPAPKKFLDKTGRDGSLPLVPIGILACVALLGTAYAVKNLRNKKDASSETDKK